jgi:hypothetical protein
MQNKANSRRQGFVRSLLQKRGYESHWRFAGQEKQSQFVGREPPRLLIVDCRLRIERCRLRTSAGGKMYKTNPISPRRRRLTEKFVRNEAKLGWTGVYRQRQQLRGPWLGRGVKYAERSQFGDRGPRLQIADCGLEDAGRGGRRRVNAQNEPNLARPEGKYAEQSQFSGRGKWS